MNRYFITGIGTNVGKTLISAVLCEATGADYWKPIQSGTAEGRDTDIVRNLVSNPTSVFHDEVYFLKEPLSPHYAAKKEGVEIDLNKIIIPQTLNKLFVEGAGGPLVPVNDRHFVIDIAKQHHLPVILVISAYLGCINHSLLAIDYLVTNRFKIHGLVLNGNFDEDVKTPIVRYKNIPVIAEIPQVKQADKKFVSDQAAKLNLYQF